MREVARYAFSALVSEVVDPGGAWTSVRRVVDEWLGSKGTRREQNGAIRIEFGDGRVADVSMIEMSAPCGEAVSLTLEEPTDGGVFRTALALARSTEVLAVACELDAGAPVQVVAPVYFDARCPRVVRDIIDVVVPWSVRRTRVSTRPRRFAGDQGGAELSALICDEALIVALVVVHDLQAALLHPGIAEGIARDLAGLAIVATSTGSAPWIVTHTLGVDADPAA